MRPICKTPPDGFNAVSEGKTLGTSTVGVATLRTKIGSNPVVIVSHPSDNLAVFISE